MTQTQSLTIDIIKIVPHDAMCYIQAPSLDLQKVNDLLEPSDFSYYRKLALTELNKNILIDLISDKAIEMYFQCFEIKLQGSRLFIAYDGMEIGILSKSLSIPTWFYDKYLITDICKISEEW
jgi:hypothetical protein